MTYAFKISKAKIIINCYKTFVGRIGKLALFIFIPHHGIASGNIERLLPLFAEKTKLSANLH